MKETFIKAAELMFKPTLYTDGLCWVGGACDAIQTALSLDCEDHPAIQIFAAIFKPDDGYVGSYWMGAPQTADKGYAPENRDRRTWALLLAAYAWRDFQ